MANAMDFVCDAATGLTRGLPLLTAATGEIQKYDRRRRARAL